MTGAASNSASTREVADLDGIDLAIWVARSNPVLSDFEWKRDGKSWLGYGSRSGVLDASPYLIIANEGTREHIDLLLKYGRVFSYLPHLSWHDGGTIIQLANIHLSPPTSPVHRFGGPNAGNGPSGHWSACTWHSGADGHRAFGWHETSPLIAAMRCFVRSVFGKTVLAQIDDLPASGAPVWTDPRVTMQPTEPGLYLRDCGTSPLTAIPDYFDGTTWYSVSATGERNDRPAFVQDKPWRRVQEGGQP